MYVCVYTAGKKLNGPSAWSAENNKIVELFP